MLMDIGTVVFKNRSIYMEQTLLYVKGLKKYYTWKKRQVRALDGIDMTVNEGEAVSVVGESGCGKSTFARTLMGLENTSGGKVVFADNDITDIGKKKMREVYKDMQMVFQNPYSTFNPKQTMKSALTEVGKFYRMSSMKIEDRIEVLLSYINMDRMLLDRYSGELSGGQLQRLAIARALMVRPRLLIADEAVSALDVSVQAQILNILMEIKEKEKMALLFISHDLSVVEHISDKVIVMYMGKIVESGSGEEIFSHPIHPYTKALLASRPKQAPWERIEPVPIKMGQPNIIDMSKGCRFAPRCPRSRGEICSDQIPELKEEGTRHKVACHFI